MRLSAKSIKISVAVFLPALLLTSGQVAYADDTFATDSSIMASAEVTVTAVVTDLPDGGQLFTYTYPDGGVMIVPYPAANFDPLTASDKELEDLYFDPRPTTPAELASWTSIMEHYNRGEAPSAQIKVPESSSTVASTAYGRLWSGWEVGQPGAQASTYLAVEGTFTVPTVAATPGCSLERFAIWIGLGGNSGAQNDLVQQGLIWCWGPQQDFRPFLEFANTQAAQDFCGYSSWTISSGRDVYQSLSYDTRKGVAKFLMSDLGPNGATHNCALPKLSSWNFNGATAEWVIEPLSSSYPNYGTLPWSGAQVETASDLAFHWIGSQSYYRLLNGQNGGAQCQAVSNVSTGGVFTITFENSTC